MLKYARPTMRHRRGVMHAIAIAFAVIALCLGALFTLKSIERCERSISEPTTTDQRLFRQDAMRLFACSVLLIGPGIWYGRLGLRGEPASDPIEA